MEVVQLLVDWVWLLRGDGRIKEVVAGQEAERLLLLGLARLHHIASGRPEHTDHLSHNISICACAACSTLQACIYVAFSARISQLQHYFRQTQYHIRLWPWLWRDHAL